MLNETLFMRMEGRRIPHSKFLTEPPQQAFLTFKRINRIPSKTKYTILSCEIQP